MLIVPSSEDCLRSKLKAESSILSDQHRLAIGTSRQIIDVLCDGLQTMDSLKAVHYFR